MIATLARGLCCACALSAALAGPAPAQDWDRLDGSVDAERLGGFLQRHLIGEPVDPADVRFLGPEARAQLPPLEGDLRYAVVEGIVVALDPETNTLLQVIRDAAGLGLGAPAAPAARATGLPDIPPGHQPPPGACRVWYPDRPPGQQPPPGPCDVAVPAGAVLIGR